VAFLWPLDFSQGILTVNWRPLQSKWTGEEPDPMVSPHQSQSRKQKVFDEPLLAFEKKKKIVRKNTC
jgi:hypothetical protein